MKSPYKLNSDMYRYDAINRDLYQTDLKFARPTSTPTKKKKPNAANQLNKYL